MPNTPGSLAFTSALDDVISLFQTTDRATTTLNGSITSGNTTITVVSTALFPSSGAFTVENEIIYYTGKTSTTFTGCIRGSAGTTGAAHSSGATADGHVIAAHHSVLASAIIAIETKLGYGASNQTPTTTGNVLTVIGTGQTAWAAPAAGAWGTLTGSLSSQADLVAALAAKQDTGNYITSLTGDVTASGSGAAPSTIANGAVSFAKMANMTNQTLIGRYAGSSGVPQSVTIGSGLSLSVGGVLSASTGLGSIGTIDSQTKSANGLVLSGSALVAQTADGGFPGLISTGAQILPGVKTFGANCILQVATVNEGYWASQGATTYLMQGAHSVADTSSAGVGGNPTLAFQSTRGGGNQGSGTIVYGFETISTGKNDTYGVYGLTKFTADMTGFAAGAYNHHAGRFYVVAGPTNIGSPNVHLYGIWAQAERTVSGIRAVGAQLDSNNNVASDAAVLTSSIDTCFNIATNYTGLGHSTGIIYSQGAKETSAYCGWYVDADSICQRILDFSNATATLQGIVSTSSTAVTAMAYTVTGASNASPIVITTSATHALTDGMPVTIASVGGNTAANGSWYAKSTGFTSTTFALYQNAALTTPVAGNGAYTSGGTAVAGTKFTKEVVLGDQVKINSVWYTVTVITDDTHLTLASSAGTQSNRTVTKTVQPLWMANSSYIMGTNAAGTAKYRMAGLTAANSWYFDVDARGVDFWGNVNLNSTVGISDQMKITKSTSSFGSVNSSLWFENPAGSGTNLWFTFAGADRGSFRIDSAGNVVFNSFASNFYFDADLGGAPTFNSPSGAINFAEGIKLSGGSRLLKVLTTTATLDFGATSAQQSSDLTITVTGAAVGDTVALGAANASVLANSSFSAWVSASDVVSVRFNNYSSGSQNPASGSFRVTVLQH